MSCLPACLNQWSGWGNFISVGDRCWCWSRSRERVCIGRREEGVERGGGETSAPLHLCSAVRNGDGVSLLGCVDLLGDKVYGGYGVRAEVNRKEN